MSLKTDNFKLYKYEDNDIGDLRFINDSMDIIDKKYKSIICSNFR